eukprot:393596_1
MSSTWLTTCSRFLIWVGIFSMVLFVKDVKAQCWDSLRRPGICSTDGGCTHGCNTACSGCSSGDPTPGPSSIPTTEPIGIHNCENDQEYIYIGVPLSATDADSYCLEHYGTHSATLKSDNEMILALSVLQSESAWIGLVNTHTAGWFVWSDGTECASSYGLCTPGSFWKIGHPRKTCNAHSGSWCVLLYQDGYIDNNVEDHCNMERPFICNCRV